MSGTYLDHHHKVLKQFLDVSDDQSSRNKPLSTRAARAREKLLNLSEAQFRELSTDVYDELKRRIDESRRDPGYLLPEASFHPKRNQAREKLSSLPQNRFKGLVSDVSYEIERRGLHIVPEPEPEPVPEVNVDSQPDGTNDDEPYHEKSLGGHASSDEVDTAPTNAVDINNSQTSPTSELPNQTIGISSKTVVPTKANLTWSSEEEDNGIEEIDDQDSDREKSRAIDADATHNGSIISPSIAEKNSMLENLKHELHLKSTENDQLKLDLETMQKNLDTEVDKNLKLSQDLESLHHDKQLSHDNVAKHQDNYDKLVKEFENVKATNAQLRLENQSLKNSVPRDNKSINNGLLSKDLSDSNHNAGGTALGVAAGAAVGAAAGAGAMGAANTKEATNRVASSSNSNELNLILQKLSTLDEPPAEKKSSFSQLKSEVVKWQKKYEDLRTSKNYTVFTKQNNLTDHQIQSLISNSGLISINLINQFQALIETFLILIDDKQANSDIIFEKVSQISIISNEIANESESHQLSKNEYSINVRDVTSHLLTVTRYYTLYSNIIPKFIIERSINELIFSICELVGYAKINNNAGEIESKVKSNTVFNNNTNVNNSNGSLISGSNRQLNNSSNTNVLDDETNLGVRPLRMANKLRSNNASNLSLDSDHKTKELNTAINNNNNMDHGNINNGISYASANTSKFSDATSKFERSTDEINVSTDKISTSSPKTTPTKKNNILDKVKQFESPPSEDFKKKFNNSPESTSNSSSFILNRSSLKIKKSPVINKYDDRSGDVSNKSIDTSAINNGSANVAGVGNRTVTGAAAAAAVGTAATGTAAVASTNGSKKGIFQSIRDRFNGDEESDGRQDTSNDNFNTTAETTPSKDSINEELESPSKPFIPVKDRIERAPSTNSDATIKGEQVPNGSTIDNKPQLLDDVDIVDNIKNEEQTESKEKRESRELISKSRDSIKASKGLIAESKQLLNESKQGINESKEEPKSKKVNFSNSDENIDSLNSLNGVNQSNGTNNKKSVKIFSEPEVIDKENSSPSKGNQSKEEEEDAEEDEKTVKARQRQEYRKSMAAATFNIDLFDIDDPDNTLTQVLLYLEHQTVEVIATIQMLLSTIKKPNATRGDLREKSKAITEVISQMTEATNTSMNQTRNFQLKEHGNWVVKSLEDCYHRMSILCKPSNDKKNSDQEFADRSFKQRLAGISFDIAKCTKELVKTVEEASLKEDIANLDARLSNDDLL